MIRTFILQISNQTREKTCFASDIESFDRIMTELSPGELPEIYGNLAHKCKDDLDRPTAIELYKAFKVWCKCMDGNCKELSNYGIDIKRQFDKAGKELRPFNNKIRTVGFASSGP